MTNKYSRPSIPAYKTFGSTVVENHQYNTPERMKSYLAISELSVSPLHNPTYPTLVNHEVYEILSEIKDKVCVNNDVIPSPNSLSDYNRTESRIKNKVLCNDVHDMSNVNDGMSLLPSTICDHNDSLITKEISSCGNSSTSEESILSACDIEQCLVQIEKSLLNIEENLRHVHDLDIPQLNNTLYEVFTGNKNHSEDIKNINYIANNSEWSSSENQLVFENLFVSDERLPPSDNNINIGNTSNSYCNSSEVLPCDNSLVGMFGNRIESNLNGCELPQKPKTHTINCNMNNEPSYHGSKKFTQRRKNLLDNKSNLSIFKKRKVSLNNYFSKSNFPMNTSRKTLSHGALEQCLKESLSTRQEQRKAYRRSSDIHSSVSLFNEIHIKLDDCDRSLKTTNIEIPRSSQKNIDKKIVNSENEDLNFEIHENGNLTENHKQTNIKNKIQPSQLSDNAIVPSKLISLSFSLLLAALLQAVRCLADLMEDTFRSMTIDKYALHD